MVKIWVMGYFLTDLFVLFVCLFFYFFKQIVLKYRTWLTNRTDQYSWSFSDPYQIIRDNAITAAFNSHSAQKEYFRPLPEVVGVKHRFISGVVSQHVSSYNVLQKCFTGNVVFWNQLQRSNASKKTSDHLATDIQSTYPSTQTTVRKDQ